MEYVLYFFVTFAGTNLEPAAPPQTYTSQVSCEFAGKLIVDDLKTKLNKNMSIYTYCVKK